MKLGIMQPYLFPYIGYYQLIQAVDKFVIYDDVTFIKGGWINRNNILGQGNKAQAFTLPLAGASSNLKINEINIDQKQWPHFKKKFRKSLEQQYRKAPFFENTCSIINECLEFQDHNLSNFLGHSLLTMCKHLGLEVDMVMHSDRFDNQNLSAQSRVLDICAQTKANTYINAIGGQALYSKEDFKHNNIDLFFLQPEPITYPQFHDQFVPYLSIIDTMMFNSSSQLNSQLASYRLI